jgi:NitT/TauT family transport system permease protein
MIDHLLRRAWGEANASLHRTRQLRWVDLLILAGLVGVAVAARNVAGEWAGPQRQQVVIDLSPLALPRYVLFSLSRGLIAYALSLGFTLVYGYWAAKDQVAERVLIPLLDVLQSIPILGFMPGLVLALVHIFPTSNIGLEMAAVLMMFTGQVWNMTFSFYHSLRAVPADLSEAGTVYRYNWWQRLRWIELPFATLGLVWNSMMSMAGGWFFLMINEAFVLGARDYRLPGIGSYMSVAVAKGDTRAMAWAVIAMMLMIVALDQLLWRPVVVWAQKFRVEEGGATEAMDSWFLSWLKRSSLVEAAGEVLRGVLRLGRDSSARRAPRVAAARSPGPAAAPSRWSLVPFVLVVALLGFGGFKLVLLLREVSLARWGVIVGSTLLTLSRVLASTAIGTLWALPAGLAIGLSPRLSRIFQPVIQVAASFPAPMLFPIVIAVLDTAHVPLGVGSIVLMLLGTQWYILFNVIAGAMAIPADLKEAARSYRLSLPQRLRTLYIPAVFSYLVTGWVTAAGGAWNASIVSEYVTFKGRVVSTPGVGSAISRAAESGDLAGLAAGVLAMSALVMIFNRNVWRRGYRLAEERFSLNR